MIAVSHNNKGHDSKDRQAHTHTQAGRQAGRQTDRQTQGDRETGRDGERERRRQGDRETGGGDIECECSIVLEHVGFSKQCIPYQSACVIVAALNTEDAS